MRLPPPMILFVFAKFWLFDLISLWGTKRVFHIDYEMMILLLLLLNATHGACAPLDGYNHKQMYQRGNIRNKYWLILFSPELVLNLNDIRLQVRHELTCSRQYGGQGYARNKCPVCLLAFHYLWIAFFLPSVHPSIYSSIHPSVPPFTIPSTKLHGGLLTMWTNNWGFIHNIYPQHRRLCSH